jgi:hypothetical protein
MKEIPKEDPQNESILILKQKIEQMVEKWKSENDALKKLLKALSEDASEQKPEQTNI